MNITFDDYRREALHNVLNRRGFSTESLFLDLKDFDSWRTRMVGVDTQELSEIAEEVERIAKEKFSSDVVADCDPNYDPPDITFDRYFKGMEGFSRAFVNRILLSSTR